MNTWTDPALETLEGYLYRNRNRIAATGSSLTPLSTRQEIEMRTVTSGVVKGG